MSLRQEAKDRLKYPTILVSIPGFPPQDPGRKMVYLRQFSLPKAKKVIKNLRAKLPEYGWSLEELTAPEVRAIRTAPFTVGGDTKVEMQWSGWGWRQKVATETETPPAQTETPPDAS